MAKNNPPNDNQAPAENINNPEAGATVYAQDGGEGEAPEEGQTPFELGIYDNPISPSRINAEIEEIAALVRRTFVSQTVLDQAGNQYLFVADGNDGMRREVIAALNPILSGHITAKETFFEPPSMVQYLRLFELGRAVIVGDLAAACFVAQLDYHSKDGPAHNQHRVTLKTPFDEDFMAWRAVIGKVVPQIELAEFLEDNLHTILTPEAADLLASINTMQVNRNAAVKQVYNADSGTIQLRYEESDSSDVQLPREVELLVPVFRGTPAISIMAKLRYRVKAGTGEVGFVFAVPSLARIIRDEFGRIGRNLQDDTGVPVLYGDTAAK